MLHETLTNFDPVTLQRFRRLCSPAEDFLPPGKLSPSFDLALPLTDKPKEPITDLIEAHMT